MEENDWAINANNIIIATLVFVTCGCVSGLCVRAVPNLFCQLSYILHLLIRRVSVCMCVCVCVCVCVFMCVCSSRCLLCFQCLER